MKKIILVLTLLASAGQVRAVDWTEQAERLQNVNATIFDAYPVLEPIKKRRVGLKTVVSVLPKVDSTVGGKTESVPAPPVHNTFLVVYDQPLAKTNLDTTLGLQMWGGGLPSGMEKAAGMDATLTQIVVGTAIVSGMYKGGWNVLFPIGIQHAEAKLGGTITQEGSTDKFTSVNDLVYFSPTASLPSYGLWAGLMIAKKRTTSTLNIEADETEVTVVDELDDASVPLAFQGSLGYEVLENVEFSASELWVPNRIAMPRFALAYKQEI